VPASRMNKPTSSSMPACPANLRPDYAPDPARFTTSTARITAAEVRLATEL
jgi:hypothetical protein